jgi:hypothetical protein
MSPRPFVMRNAERLAIVVLSFVSSGIGLQNSFTYDDLYIILRNGVVHRLSHVWSAFLLPYWPVQFGGDGYRPLTITLFAIEWALAGRHAWFFHAVSLVLYALVGVLVYELALRIMDRKAAWVAAAIAVVHPVHVEAVASAVGQAELLAAIFVLAAVILYIDARKTAGFTRGRIVAIIALYLAGCLSKEHAIVVPLLFLWADTTILADVPFEAHRRRLLYTLAGATGLGFITFRWLILGGHGVGGFSPFIPFVSLKTDGVERFLTVVGVIPTWTELLLWPTRLMSEYGPPEFAVARGLAVWQIPGALILSGVIGLTIALRKKQRQIAFGLGWMMLTLVPASNILVATGVLVAERTLFTPSLGIALVMGSIWYLVADRLRAPFARVGLLAASGALFWFGIIRSVVQTASWRSNETLFLNSVRSSPLSYRSHYVRGSWLMATGRRLEGEREYTRAIGLFPDDPIVLYNFAQEMQNEGRLGPANRWFARVDSLNPDFYDVKARRALVLAMRGEFEEASVFAREAQMRNVGDRPMLDAILNAASLKARRNGKPLSPGK